MALSSASFQRALQELTQYGFKPDSPIVGQKLTIGGKKYKIIFLNREGWKLSLDLKGGYLFVWRPDEVAWVLEKL